jgi:hypothetical protein
VIVAPDIESKAETGKGATENARLVDSFLSTALFLLLFLLVANVSVLIIARDTNDAACRAALAVAAREMSAGKEKSSIVKEALDVLRLRGSNSFFVQPPEFVEYKDTAMSDGRHSLEMRTRVLARVPAPFLMPNAPFNSDGQLSISGVSQVGLKKARHQKALGDEP